MVLVSAIDEPVDQLGGKFKVCQNYWKAEAEKSDRTGSSAIELHRPADRVEQVLLFISPICRRIVITGLI